MAGGSNKKKQASMQNYNPNYSITIIMIEIEDVVVLQSVSTFEGIILKIEYLLQGVSCVSEFWVSEFCFLFGYNHPYFSSLEPNKDLWKIRVQPHVR